MGHRSNRSSIYGGVAIAAVLAAGGEGAANPIQPATGHLQISVNTTGELSSGKGFSYILDANPPEPIAFNTTIQLRSLFVGAHTIELTSLPPECSVATTNPVTVGVTDDVAAMAAFEVDCSASPP